jgi:hypothetical protein
VSDTGYLAKTAHRNQRQRRASAEREYAQTSLAVLARDLRCVYCRRPPEHVHHVRYRSHGVDHGMDNLVTLCCRCHDEIHAGKLFCTAVYIFPYQDNAEYRVHIGWVFSKDREFSKCEFRSVNRGS